MSLEQLVGLIWCFALGCAYGWERVRRKRAEGELQFLRRMAIEESVRMTARYAISLGFEQIEREPLKVN